MQSHIDTAAPSHQAPPRTSGPGEDVKVDETTELRWFFDGALPSDVSMWFTKSGTAGLGEDRCDSYRVDGMTDIGVKWRFGTKLELKLRHEPSSQLHLAAHVAGRLESWQRWSPADGAVQVQDDMKWQDANKSIVKRRFDARGREVPLTSETRAMSGDGCDAEVVAIRLGDREAWSFALAAFGPTSDHRPMLEAAWCGLVGDQAPPTPLRLDEHRSCGYPEWLAAVGAAQSLSS